MKLYLGDGSVRKDLVSGLDIAATSLALAGIPIPKYMESRDLLARRFVPRDYVISARDRCDYTIDRIRTVRTEQFRYIRNYFPERPYMQPNYRDAWEITKLMRRLHSEGKLDAVQDRFWSEERPAEELYDLKKDPGELNNVADKPEYAMVKNRLTATLMAELKATNDPRVIGGADAFDKYRFYR